jgi:hypothetical protein
LMTTGQLNADAIGATATRRANVRVAMRIMRRRLRDRGGGETLSESSTENQRTSGFVPGPRSGGAPDVRR